MAEDIAQQDTQNTAASLTGGRLFLLLTLLCAVLYLPGLAAIPPTDRDESRFMQASKQMIETGDWVHINFQAEPRNKKPIGIYWLQAASVKIFGQDLNVAWPYRVPSVIAAWLAVLAVGFAGRQLFNPAAGLMAGAILATSFIVVVEAHIAKTDAALLAATTIAMTMLARLYTEAEVKWPPVLAFWAALGVGILLKGPVIVLVAGATILALCIADRDFHGLLNLKPLAGIPLMLVIVLPWVIAISGGGGETSQGNFFSDALLHDLLPKLIGGQESHGAPPGTYLAAGLLTAWPWSVLAPFAVIAAWKQRDEPAVRFCLAWLIPAWIVFEIVPTKLPHYTMPLYPALALLIAWLFTSEDFKQRVTGKAALAWRILWIVVPLAAIFGIALAVKQFGENAAILAGAAALFLLIAGLYVIFGLARVAPRTSAIVLTVLAALFAVTLTEGIIPRLTFLALSPRLAEAVKDRTGRVALAGFHEPSAVFLMGTDTILTTTEGAAEYILENPGAVAIVPKGDVKAVEEIAGDRVVDVEDSIGGYNYSRDGWMRLAVIKARVATAGPDDPPQEQPQEPAQ